MSGESDSGRDAAARKDIMGKQTILVTGSTGKTGTQVVRQLLDAGWPVRAAVHRLDERSERLQKLGAEVVVTDLYDYEQTLAAMQGIRRAYFCPPVQPFMIQAAAVFAAAAADAGLEFIAQLSQWIASPAHPSIHTRQLWLVERMFATIPGVSHTVINPGVVADSLLGVIPGAVNAECAKELLGFLARSVDHDPNCSQPSIRRGEVRTRPQLPCAASPAARVRVRNLAARARRSARASPD